MIPSWVATDCRSPCYHSAAGFGKKLDELVSEKKIKVTDKRMFTPDGELRDEFQRSEGETEEAPPSPEAPAFEAPAE